MGSSHDSRYWTCPHCFSVIDWEREGAVKAHKCPEMLEAMNNRSKTRHLDTVIKTLKPRKGRKRG
jgi:hypothetical protein